MKVLSINLGNYSSTGNITQGIKSEAIRNGVEYILTYPFDMQNKEIKEEDWLIGNKFGRKSSIALGMITGFNGCFSAFATQKLLNRISHYEPDIIHFHNLHNNYINLPMLFWYVKKSKIKIVWTLHDCWSFTGQCPHFEMVNCSKWKTGCHHCTSFREYPKAFVDNTKIMWKLKKKWFTQVENMTIVTPSEWLADLVKQSFFRGYPVKVIHNGIDLDVFKPIQSDFRVSHGIDDKKNIVMGVAFNWGKRKGLDVFIELANRLDTEAYQIVLVGTDDTVDTQLPDNIISIHRTQNQTELAKIYTAADVFVNPTREENYPTVNMEAIACGTPVLTFNTGGSPEILDKTCGSVVDCDDIDAMEKEIILTCENEPYTETACLKRAKSFDKKERYMEYINLYESIITE